MVYKIQITLFLLISLVSSKAFGTVIDFNDGATSNTAISSYYLNSDGVSLQGWRFHQSTLAINTPFPFVDNWGAVVDFGANGDSTTGHINFSHVVNFLEMDVYFHRGNTVGNWSLIAYDILGNIVNQSSGAVLGNAPGQSIFDFQTIRVSANGLISRVDFIRPDNTIGVDTMRFSTVPEPASIILMLVGLAGIRLLWRA